MQDDIKIVQGYQSELLNRVTEMHADFYSVNYGFGLEFEKKVGFEMAEFLTRLPKPPNEVWSAIRQDKIIGSISIDGEAIGNGTAHLRWFVMDDLSRGSGIGSSLLQSASEFVDKHNFHETHLWTFKSLDAARRLYEKNGFILTQEKPGSQWGSEVLEQKFIRSIAALSTIN